MTAAPSRIAFSRTPSSVLVRIEPLKRYRKLMQALFLSLPLLALIPAFAFTPGEVALEVRLSVTILVVITCSVVSALVAWSYYASDYIQVRDRSIVMGRKASGIGSSRRLPLSRTSNLKATSHEITTVDLDTFVVWTVTFQCEGVEQHFGRDLSEEEARAIVEALEPYMIRA
jgi:hypothetical protein